MHKVVYALLKIFSGFFRESEVIKKMSNYEKKQICSALYYLKLADDCVNAGNFNNASCTIERMHSFIEHDLITLAFRLYALSTKGGASK